MTLNRKVLKKIHSPAKSPKLANSSLKKRELIRRLSLNQEVLFGAASKANLKVVVRIRPENEREIENGSRSVIEIVDQHMMVFDPSQEEEGFFFRGTKQKFRDLNKRHHKEQKFAFERIFGPQSTNEEIFETTTKDIVETVLSGYNCSVFAYGATGAGKTFTMIGNASVPGITFLTVMELYKRIEESTEKKHCEVGVSYLEVYNEMVRDLLDPGKPLNLHENGHHVQVTGLSLHKPKDAEDLLKILAQGNLNRSQHPTDVNAESSRSHAVFQVFVKQHDRTPGITSAMSIAKLSMIDLAGSERGLATGYKGARFREGATINKSLLALGNCINALADGKRHIPYRDSKLTRLLKDCLGGNCRSVMIAAVSKSSMSFEDTFNTLRYANRAKTIKTVLKKNIVNVDEHVSRYLHIVEELQLEVASLKAKLKDYESKECKTSSSEGSGETNEASTNIMLDHERGLYEETIQGLKKQLEERYSHPNEAEEGMLNQLYELNDQLKGYQRELLKLETNERELELKMYTHRLQLVRMNLLVFASYKLEKSITKTERSIKSFLANLQHIQKRKAYLQNKIKEIKSMVTDICISLKQFGPNKQSLHYITESKLKQKELEQTIRDSHQTMDYLKDLVKKMFAEQKDAEKLILSLLVTMKHFYLRLRSLNYNDTEMDEMFDNILSVVNVNRLEWADLQDAEMSLAEKMLCKLLGSERPSLDENRLTTLPIISAFTPSPYIISPEKLYRKSIMKPNQTEIRKVPEECLLPTLHEKSPNVPLVVQKPKILKFLESYPREVESPSCSGSASEGAEPSVAEEMAPIQDGAQIPEAFLTVGVKRSISIVCDSDSDSEKAPLTSLNITDKPSPHLDKIYHQLSPKCKKPTSPQTSMSPNSPPTISPSLVDCTRKPALILDENQSLSATATDSELTPVILGCHPSIDSLGYESTTSSTTSSTNDNQTSSAAPVSVMEDHHYAALPQLNKNVKKICAQNNLESPDAEISLNEEEPSPVVHILECSTDRNKNAENIFLPATPIVFCDGNSTFSLSNNLDSTFSVSNGSSSLGVCRKEKKESGNRLSHRTKVIVPPKKSVGNQVGRMSYAHLPQSCPVSDRSMKRTYSMSSLHRMRPKSVSTFPNVKKSPAKSLKKHTSFLKPKLNGLKEKVDRNQENKPPDNGTALQPFTLSTESKKFKRTPHQTSNKVLRFFNSRSNLESNRPLNQEKLMPKELVSCLSETE